MTMHYYSIRYTTELALHNHYLTSTFRCLHGLEGIYLSQIFYKQTSFLSPTSTSFLARQYLHIARPLPTGYWNISNTACLTMALIYNYHTMSRRRWHTQYISIHIHVLTDTYVLSHIHIHILMGTHTNKKQKNAHTGLLFSFCFSNQFIKLWLTWGCYRRFIPMVANNGLTQNFVFGKQSFVHQLFLPLHS